MLDAVAESSRNGLHVLGEGPDRRPVGPAAAILERLRQVPVVERHERLDAGGEQLVDEPVVEVEPGRVHLSAAVREDPGPRDGEPERADAELAHQRDVVAVPVVEVAGDRAAVAVADLAVGGAEAVPDALAAAVLVHRALDLVRRRRDSPREGFGERHLSGVFVAVDH